MSREAILAALQKSQPVPQKDGIAALPADPLRNPKAIAVNREKMAGSYACGGAVKQMMGGGQVSGPGGPRDDMIDAKLSDGEHVITAEEIRRLGGGDQEAGHAKMSALRRLMMSGGM